jgi:L-arabinokinase
MAVLADYDAARAYFHREPSTAWAAYVAGVPVVLSRELGVRYPAGLRLVAFSRVPEGKGVSSSAALEVATMQAIVGLLGLSLPGVELARLCQMVENHVVGAPCGIMDQLTSALGHADHLMTLLCQPAEVKQFIRLPDGVAVWGIDSGVRHAVSGSDYTAVRTGAFMGYRIVAELAGLRPAESDLAGVARFDDPHWRGYLANLPPEEFDTRFGPQLPDEIRGADFLRRYGGTTDRVTRVDPDRVYAVRMPTAHPVHEHARVCRFAELLSRPADRSTLVQMGALMYASHTSYSACGLGSAATDRLVELVREAGPAAGLYGAKITGGGSGGTVAVLGRSDADAAVADLARRYALEAGRGGYVFRGSSPGACPFGVQRIELAEEEWTT